MKRDTIPGTNVGKSLVDLLYESRRTFCHALYWYKVIKFNHRTFKLSVVMRNGSDMNDCKIQVMNQNGSFDFVANAYETDAPYENNYFNIEESGAEIKVINMCAKCFESMVKYITAVYA